MRPINLTGFAAAVTLAMTPALSPGAVTVNSVTQGYSLFGPSGGGGGNSNVSLPLININETMTDDSNPNNVVIAKAKQTITGYVGPAALGQAANALSFKIDASTSLISNPGSASTDFTLNFTLDFGESYSYTRSSSLAGGAKLLFQGLQNQTEIAPGSGVLGRGTYIVKVNLSDSNEATLNLQIPAPAPEPASLSLLALGAALLSRRRHPPQ